MSDYGVTKAAQVPAKQSTMAAALASREMEQVKGQITMARRFPRDITWSRSKILEECKRPELAEKAEYTYPRGTEQISGPSIHLAMTVARNYGNCEADWRELEQGDGYSKIEAYFWDMETNFRRSITFDVKHERHTRFGVTKLTDPRDIYEVVANNASRRLRAVILQGVPGDIVDEAVAACRQTIKDALSKDDPKKLLAKARKLVDAFSKYSVTAETLTKHMDGRTPEQWTADDIAELTRIGTSLADGVVKPADIFESAKDTQVISKAQMEEVMKIIGKNTTKGIEAMVGCGYTKATLITVSDLERVKAAISKAVSE